MVILIKLQQKNFFDGMNLLLSKDELTVDFEVLFTVVKSTKGVVCFVLISGVSFVLSFFILWCTRH